MKSLASKPNAVELDLRPDEIERVRRALKGRLRTAILEAPENGDAGHVAGFLADIRALDAVVGVKPPAPVEPPTDVAPHVQEQRDAAADSARMQKYNRKIALKERGEAAARSERGD